KHGVHYAELFLTAPVQNVGVSRKYGQHLRRTRRAARRLHVPHQVSELFRRHVVIWIQFVLLERGLILSRRKLVEGHTRSGIAGEQRVSVRVFSVGDSNEEWFGRKEIFAFFRFGVLV